MLAARSSASKASASPVIVVLLCWTSYWPLGMFTRIVRVAVPCCTNPPVATLSFSSLRLRSKYRRCASSITLPSSRSSYFQEVDSWRISVLPCMMRSVTSRLPLLDVLASPFDFGQPGT